MFSIYYCSRYGNQYLEVHIACVKYLGWNLNKFAMAPQCKLNLVFVHKFSKMKFMLAALCLFEHSSRSDSA